MMLPGQGIDAILGMNWLRVYGVILDLKWRVVELWLPSSEDRMSLLVPSDPVLLVAAHAKTSPDLASILVVCEFLDVFPEDLMGTGIPIFRQVKVTIVVAENDTPIRLQIQRSNPAILAPQLLWLSTKSWTRLTSPRRLIPACAMKNTSKNKKECNQIADE